MFTKTISAIRFNVSRGGLIAKKFAPEALLIAGIGGMIGSTILACKVTLKVEETIAPHVVEISEIRESSMETKEENQELAKIYAKIGLDLAKLYGPAVILGGLSIAAIVGSHSIVSNRLAAVGAAYAALDKSFKQFRQNVEEKVGTEETTRLVNGWGEEEVDITDSSGKKVGSKLAHDPTLGDLSIYARWFDEGSAKWSDIPAYNRMFLTEAERMMNDRLIRQGHVFLNEVYDMLGFKRTREGSVVGWVHNGSGDGYIDFGVNFDKPSHRDFVNGWTNAILLDFNVDGVIYDLIG